MLRFLSRKSKKLTDHLAARPKWVPTIHIRRDKTARLAVDKLMETSKLEPSFFVMSGLSGALATLGILLNDTAILIAAMVLAPLLNPLLACAAGVSILNRRLIAYALKTFLGSMVFVILVSATLVYALTHLGHSFDISDFAEKFKRFDSLLFLAAFISGFAGVYAWLKATHLTNLVGVAIAVSLIPFVSFFGVLLGLQEFSLIHDYWRPFSINLATIIGCSKQDVLHTPKVSNESRRPLF